METTNTDAAAGTKAYNLFEKLKTSLRRCFLLSRLNADDGLWQNTCNIIAGAHSVLMILQKKNAQNTSY
jgi:hypothetical protein